MDIVILSRSAPKEPFTIGYDYVNGVTVENLKVVYQSKDYYEYRKFEKCFGGNQGKHNLALFHKYWYCHTTAPGQHLRGVYSG